MTPALRLSFSLVLSLLLWLPTVPSALTSHQDPATIALRYLGALLIARVGVGLVFRVIGSYAAPLLAEDEPEDEAEEPPAETAAEQSERLQRRREDQMILDSVEDDATELIDANGDGTHDAGALVP